MEDTKNYFEETIVGSIDQKNPQNLETQPKFFPINPIIAVAVMLAIVGAVLVYSALISNTPQEPVPFEIPKESTQSTTSQNVMETTQTTQTTKSNKK